MRALELGAHSAASRLSALIEFGRPKNSPAASYTLWMSSTPPATSSRMPTARCTASTAPSCSAPRRQASRACTRAGSVARAGEPGATANPTQARRSSLACFAVIAAAPPPPPLPRADPADGSTPGSSQPASSSCSDALSGWSALLMTSSSRTTAGVRRGQGVKRARRKRAASRSLQRPLLAWQAPYACSADIASRKSLSSA